MPNDMARVVIKPAQVKMQQYAAAPNSSPAPTASDACTSPSSPMYAVTIPLIAATGAAITTGATSFASAIRQRGYGRERDEAERAVFDVVAERGSGERHAHYRQNDSGCQSRERDGDEVVRTRAVAECRTT